GGGLEFGVEKEATAVELNLRGSNGIVAAAGADQYDFALLDIDGRAGDEAAGIDACVVKDQAARAELRECGGYTVVENLSDGEIGGGVVGDRAAAVERGLIGAEHLARIAKD